MGAIDAKDSKPEGVMEDFAKIERVKHEDMPVKQESRKLLKRESDTKVVKQEEGRTIDNPAEDSVDDLDLSENLVDRDYSVSASTPV